MRVTIDEDRCRGHGICSSTCPEVFSLSADGYAEVSSAEVAQRYWAATRQAAANCPEQAITVEPADVSAAPPDRSGI